MAWHEWLGPLARLPADGRLEDWYAAVQQRTAGTEPFAGALLGGRLAATPGLAFLAGYQQALRALWADAPAGLGALCATENRRLRPADMTTRLRDGRLDGRKDFVTAGDAAAWLLVPAREERIGDAPRLGMHVLAADAGGVVLEAGAPLPLLPDIAHGRLVLVEAIGERLPGDGWADYVKPFRTHEDLYVLVALLGWLYGVALEHRWSQALLLRLVGLLAGAAEVARQPVEAAATHVLLAALSEQFAALQAELEGALAATPGEWSAMWLRDRGVLGLARGAQAERLRKAWLRLGLAGTEEEIQGNSTRGGAPI